MALHQFPPSQTAPGPETDRIALPLLPHGPPILRRDSITASCTCSCRSHPARCSNPLAGVELPALELEGALLAGVGRHHRQHAFVYIDTRSLVRSFHRFPQPFRGDALPLEHTVKWLSTLSYYRRPAKGAGAHSLVQMHAPDRTDLRPRPSPLRGPPRPVVRHLIRCCRGSRRVFITRGPQAHPDRPGGLPHWNVPQNG
jgi:hypothetical protein